MSDKNIILITDPAVLSIPIHECGEEVVDVKKLDGIKYAPPETLEAKPHYTLLRRTVYEKLLAAQNLLPDNVKLRLYEGFRSPQIQQAQFEQTYDKNLRKHIDLSKEQIFLKTTELVSPIINLDGSKNVPPHSTGGAFDMELIDRTGKVLNMGMEVKNWATADLAICRTNSEIISAEARRNRKLLSDCLAKVGFVNYPTEWWHWSYGDRYWAYHVKEPCAIYGTIGS